MWQLNFSSPAALKRTGPFFFKLCTIISHFPLFCFARLKQQQLVAIIHVIRAYRKRQPTEPGSLSGLPQPASVLHYVHTRNFYDHCSLLRTWLCCNSLDTEKNPPVMLHIYFATVPFHPFCFSSREVRHCASICMNYQAAPPRIGTPGEKFPEYRLNQ